MHNADCAAPSMEHYGHCAWVTEKANTMHACSPSGPSHCSTRFRRCTFFSKARNYMTNAYTSDRRRVYLSSLWSAQSQKRYINGKAATNVKDCKESGKGSNWRVQTLESLIALSHSLRALKATKTRTNRIHHGQRKA